MKKLGVVIMSILISSGMYANTIRMTSYESVKQKAMGGTTLLSEANESALVSNPALLNEIDKWEINILGIGVSIPTDISDTVNGITSMLDDLDGLNDINEVENVLNAYLTGTSTGTYNKNGYKLEDKRLVIDINQAIAFVKKNFGVGEFTSVSINDFRLINNNSNTEVTADIGGTVQIPVGMAFDFGKKNQYVFGTSIKAVGGANATAIANASDIVAENSSIPYTVEAYKGVALDLGSIWRTNYLNYAMTVSNAFSSLNVVTKTGDNGVEVKTNGEFPLSVNLAISNKYDRKDRLDKWWDKHAFWTLELKNITNEDINADGKKDNEFDKKIHFGASTMVFNNNWIKLDLRAGINQSHPTFGFGTEMFSFLNLDYAYGTRAFESEAGTKEETLHSLTVDFRL